METYETKECPCCASSDVDIEQDWQYGSQTSEVFVVCRVCGTRSKSKLVHYGQDPDKAIEEVVKAWNTRIMPEETKQNDEENSH